MIRKIRKSHNRDDQKLGDKYAIDYILQKSQHFEKSLKDKEKLKILLGKNNIKSMQKMRDKEFKRRI